MRMLFQRGLLLGSLVAPAVAWSGDVAQGGTTQVGAAQVGAAQVGAAQVKIDNFTFGPAKLSIAKGSAVTWTNQDDIPHSIVLTTLGVRSKALDSDTTFTYQFDKAGTFSYICGLHPVMHGLVVVK